jgi:hypothetical protein
MFPVKLPEFIFIHGIKPILPQKIFCSATGQITGEFLSIVQFPEAIVNSRIRFVSFLPRIEDQLRTVRLVNHYHPSMPILGGNSVRSVVHFMGRRPVHS